MKRGVKMEISVSASPRVVQPIKLYLVKHPAHGEATARGRNKLEAVKVAARAWGVPWTSIARECDFVELIREGAV